MHRLMWVLAIIICIGMGVFYRASALQLPIKYNSFKLERVIDGDSFIASGLKIRVWGIDAPEKGEAFYEDATNYLTHLLHKTQLRCKPISRDQYKRHVMHCKAAEEDIGAALVEQGLATDYRRYSGGFYQFEEGEAQRLQRGIWNKVATPEKTVFCTSDVKLCTDGSYVSRKGPDCAFAACPSL